ncbi:MAG: hypothetical protein KGN76_11405 [Acidobacteriota bacterium]|nr:hypothetical protein [Acidobacteriota bacterium]
MNDSSPPGAGGPPAPPVPGPGATAAAAAYTLLAIAMTWPLVRGLGRDLPGGLGDPLLNCWILAWDAHHLLRFVGGHLHGLSGYWNANIFYPAPLALAYSEHLTAQAIEILPVYAISGNPILCYNLLLLSTVVLSGLGTYLLVRELTGRRWPAFVAGVVFAFLPYRAAQIPHLQVLSSQWMAFALFGFVRYFRTGRRRALAGGALALVAQNLSCGYFMVFFTVPFVAFVLVEIGRRRLWTDGRCWRDLAVAAAGVTAVTLPFAWPYLRLRELGFAPRSLAEVNAFAADTWSYLTTAGSVRLWGSRLQLFQKPEGELFPGFTAIALALAGLVAGLRASWRQTADRTDAGSRWRRVLAAVLTIVVIVYAGLGLAMLVAGPFALHMPFGVVRVTSADWLLRVVVMALVLLVVGSRRARAFLGQFTGGMPGLYVCLLLAAAWLSLGPVLHAGGRDLHAPSLYLLAYRLVPGFNGLRVPARYGMIAGLFLAVVAGAGAQALERRRAGIVLLLAACTLVLAEADAAPLALNGRWTEPDETAIRIPAGPMPARAAFPPVYAFLRTLPPGAPVVEFPFGEYPLEVRYMYFSTAHWHPLLNGYSGGFPPAYLLLRDALRDVLTNPGRAWDALAGAGAAYAIVHAALYRGTGGAQVAAWLQAHGARPVAAFGDDRVFALPASGSGPSSASGSSQGGTPPATISSYP